ncbi:MAG: hypothetical protein HOP99_01145, partial [Dermatophilaceae bacterium]|nr:hypothetical protein [Dermatophilaceae bacterium]
EARAFAEREGYPLILKPRAGAGAQGTVRVDDDHELEQALQGYAREGATSIAIEEFVEGHEGFYDTITLDGHVVHDWATHYYPNVLEAMRHRWISPQFITTNRIDEFVAGHEGFYDTITLDGHVVHDWATHYYPNVLEAMRHRWISPQFITTNRIDEPGNSFYAEVRELGRRVIQALGIETSATHMEWFYGPKGLKFSEIGCRPPGVGAWDVYSAANGVDVYREWAHVITHRAPEQQMKRTYAAGIVALRPDRDGSITGYSGIDEIQARYGEWVIDGHFPPVGHGTQGVEAGYMANAWVRLRHPDYDTVKAMLDDVGRTIRVHAG